MIFQKIVSVLIMMLVLLLFLKEERSISSTAGGLAQVAEHLPSKPKALSSNISITKKREVFLVHMLVKKLFIGLGM
jgi:hypothetical protein